MWGGVLGYEIYYLYDLEQGLSLLRICENILKWADDNIGNNFLQAVEHSP